MKKFNHPKTSSVLSLTVLLILIPLCLACNQSSENSTKTGVVPGTDPLEGVWELSNQYWVKDGDTLYQEPDLIGYQHKTYLDGYVMWIAYYKPDSSSGQGFGTYQLSNDLLIEKLSSMSTPAGTSLAEEIHFKVEFDQKSLKQESETIFRNTDYLLITEWKKLN